MKETYLSNVIKLIKGTNGQGLQLLPHIKRTFGYNNYEHTIKTIMNNISYKDYFTKELFPTDIDNIITRDYIPLSFDMREELDYYILNEILCFVSLFQCFNNELKCFVKLRNNFEYYLFSGQYENANKILLNIKEKFGFSFWLIESQLLLANFSMSVVQAESFYQNLKNECNDYYIKSYIRALRRKTNTYESAKDSQNFINKKAKDFTEIKKNISEYKQIYFSFNNNRFEELSKNSIKLLLGMAPNLNLVDMFLLIDKIIIYIIADRIFSDTDVKKIINVISDFSVPLRCKCICDLINKKIDEQEKLTEIVYDLKMEINYAVKNNFSNCKKVEIKQYCASFDVVLSNTMLKLLGQKSIKFDSDLLGMLVEVIELCLLKDGNYNIFTKIVNNAERLLLLLDSTTMNFGYTNFYTDVFKGDNSQFFKSVVSSGYYNRYALSLINFDNDELFKVFNDRFGCFECNWYHNISIDERLKYDQITMELYNIENTAAVDNMLYMMQSKTTVLDIILFNRCCERLYVIYINNGEIILAIKLYVDLQFESKFKVCNFDNDLLTRKLNGVIIPKLYSNIDFCIYAHLTNFRGAVGLRYNTQVANSIMAILKANKMKFPSELYNQIDMNSWLERAKYAYLFRHICGEDLLKSRLTGYSINTETMSEQTKIVLEERKQLLLLTKSLESSEEISQIESQIEKIDRKIGSIDNVNLSDYMVLYAKILEDAISVSDTDIILPFYKSINNIKVQQTKCNFDDFSSGEFLIFRDSFVKYKEAYLKSLDEQIGINIRHGFLKNEIINFFYERHIAFKKFPSKESEVSACIDNKIIKLRESEENTFLIGYIYDIVNFSKDLYNFVDHLLVTLRIKSSSEETDGAFDIFIQNKEISKLAKILIETNNPYEFKNKLHKEMSEIIDPRLQIIGNYIEKTIKQVCVNLINEHFEKPYLNDYKMLEKMKNVKNDVANIAGEIKKWFKFVKNGDELCSISKYFSALKNKKNYIFYSLSDNIPDGIKFYQLHILDLILLNLIMNAEEHSGLDKHQLKIHTSLSVNKNIMKIYFSNNLSVETNKDYILEKMAVLECNLSNCKNNNYVNKGSGNGFFHIAHALNSLVDSNWQVSFCKDELPKKFALNITIDWSGLIEKSISD
ncbi:MAG: hypothetical protein E7538_07940 [Ruminococcaceae bacterium]|nr:hypothetical protein [Oscillospiraceae bacterium]